MENIVLTVRVTDNRGGVATSNPVGIEVIAPVSNDRDTTGNLPVSLALHQNFPNPFSERTTILFDVPAPVYVKLGVFDTGGRHIYNLVDHIVVQGSHSVNWERDHLSNGVYFLRLQTKDGVHTRQAIILN